VFRGYRTCAVYWPPVPGPATAELGFIGTISRLTRSGVTVQSTFDGHPLYTYIGDSGPGEANGDNLNLDGGLWHKGTAPRSWRACE
jgi:predicted lipoprotein with Yx(FWY)xxD motif